MARVRTLQSAPLLMPSIALSVGIFCGDRWPVSPAWFALLATALLGAWYVRRRGQWQSVAVLLCVVALGGWRSSVVQQSHERVTWPDAVVGYEAVVMSELSEKAKTMGMDIVIAGRNGRLLKCYIAKDEHSRRLQIGDRLQLRSRIERVSNWRHGSFNYRRYLETHGFAGQTFVRADNWQADGRSWQGLGFWQQLRLRFLCYRHQLTERYRRMGARGDDYAVVAAMTLGDKSAMRRSLRDVYAVSGASHVLALSGLHLGIIYTLLSLLVVGRRRRFVSQVFIVLAIWAFALLVGLPASVVRSAVMISTYALLSIANRGRPSLNALSLAAILILTVNPDSLFDVGFQLSFAAMLAILTLLPLSELMVSRQWLLDHPVLRWTLGLASTSLAAQIGVAPLVAYYFGRFSTYFLLTNFIVIPATIVILYLALASLLLPAVGGWLLWVVGSLNVVLTFMSSRLPLASIEGLHPSAVQTAMVYVIIVSLYFIILIRYGKRV